MRHLPLTTPRLLLRDFVASDLPEVHALRSDPEVNRFLDDAPPRTRDETRAWLDDVMLHNGELPRRAYNLAIVRRAENRVIGWIGTGPSSRYPDPGELGFGYMLNRAYWGQGYVTEAVRAVVAFGFEALSARRQSAWCYAENVASARVLEKAGLPLVKRYTHPAPGNGQPTDCLEYAIRSEEWLRIT